MSSCLRQYKHHQPKLGRRVMVDPQATVIGQVTLGDDVSIWPHVTIRGDVHFITIGARTNIQDNSVLHVSASDDEQTLGAPLIIGSDVTVGHSVILHGCTIGNSVLIGMGSIILDKTIIEDNVMVGAGSLVPGHKRLESGYLYLGRPAKRVRLLTQEEIHSLTESSQHYVQVKNNYLMPISNHGDQTS